jgi:hypothetical protein
MTKRDQQASLEISIADTKNKASITISREGLIVPETIQCGKQPTERNGKSQLKPAGTRMYHNFPLGR